MPHHLQLISLELCPYVDRSRIVLLEKGLPHEVTFVDLAAKPDWFLAVSPMGRVPVLRVDGTPVFESMIINELLDELQPEPRLLPADPVARAAARGWVVFANDAVFPVGHAAAVALAGGLEGDALARPLGELRAALQKLEVEVARRGSPFFAGSAFSLVDAAYAPFFRRWRTVEAWERSEARLLAGLPVVSAWAEALLARPSVRAAEPSDFAARYRRSCESRAARDRAGR
jgi:glutathione S-transferase